MGAVVRFPQELCRWPALSDQHFPPAEIVILPAVRVERAPGACPRRRVIDGPVLLVDAPD